MAESNNHSITPTEKKIQELTIALSELDRELSVISERRLKQEDIEAKKLEEENDKKKEEALKTGKPYIPAKKTPNKTLEALVQLERRRKQEYTALVVEKAKHEVIAFKENKQLALVAQKEQGTKNLPAVIPETESDGKSVEKAQELKERKKALRDRKLRKLNSFLDNPKKAIFGAIGNGIGNLLNTKESKKRQMNNIKDIDEEIEYYKLKGDDKKVQELIEKKLKQEEKLAKKNSKDTFGTNTIGAGITKLKTSKANFIGDSLDKFTEELKTQLKKEKKAVDEAVALFGYTKVFMEQTKTLEKSELDNARKAVQVAVDSYHDAVNKIRKKYGFETVDIKTFIGSLGGKVSNAYYDDGKDDTPTEETKGSDNGLGETTKYDPSELYKSMADSVMSEHMRTHEKEEAIDVEIVKSTEENLEKTNSESTTSEVKKGKVNKEAPKTFGFIGALGASLGIKNSLTDEEFEAKDKTKMIKISQSIEKNLEYIAENMVDEQDTTIERKDYSKKGDGKTEKMTTKEEESKDDSLLHLLAMAGAYALKKIAELIWKFIGPKVAKLLVPFKAAMQSLKGIINKVTKTLFGKEMFSIDKEVSEKNKNKNATRNRNKGAKVSVDKGEISREPSKNKKRQSRKMAGIRGRKGRRRRDVGGDSGGCGCVSDLASDFDLDREKRDKKDKIRDKKSANLEKKATKAEGRLGKLISKVGSIGSKVGVGMAGLFGLSSAVHGGETEADRLKKEKLEADKLKKEKILEAEREKRKLATDKLNKEPKPMSRIDQMKAERVNNNSFWNKTKRGFTKATTVGGKLGTKAVGAVASLTPAAVVGVGLLALSAYMTAEDLLSIKRAVVKIFGLSDISKITKEQGTYAALAFTESQVDFFDSMEHNLAEYYVLYYKNMTEDNLLNAYGMLEGDDKEVKKIFVKRAMRYNDWDLLIKAGILTEADKKSGKAQQAKDAKSGQTPDYKRQTPYEMATFKDKKEKTKASKTASPVRGDYRISSEFGAREAPTEGASHDHKGRDYASAEGTPVVSQADGKVITAGEAGGYGNLITIDHGNGVTSRYGHLSAMYVKVGDKITAETVIGAVGNTGVSTGAHLHYEVRKDNVPQDPRYITDLMAFSGQKRKTEKKNDKTEKTKATTVMASKDTKQVSPTVKSEQPKTAPETPTVKASNSQFKAKQSGKDKYENDKQARAEVRKNNPTKMAVMPTKSEVAIKEVDNKVNQVIKQQNNTQTNITINNGSKTPEKKVGQGDIVSQRNEKLLKAGRG